MFLLHIKRRCKLVKGNWTSTKVWITLIIVIFFYAFLLNIIKILSVLMSVEIKKMFNIITLYIYQIPGSLSQYLLISLFPVKVVLFIWLLKASYSKIFIILMQIMQINEKITILVCWTRLGRKRYTIKLMKQWIYRLCNCIHNRSVIVHRTYFENTKNQFAF